MSGPVVVGDVLVFPLASKSEVTVKWAHMGKDYSEVYYAITTTNSTRGNTGVNMYVQKSIYDSQFDTFATVDGENGKVSITNKFQYGQKNADGTSRWVVLHDTTHTPFQHRFIETTLQSQLGGYAQAFAVNMGYTTIAGTAETFAKRLFGDRLKAY